MENFTPPRTIIDIKFPINYLLKFEAVVWWRAVQNGWIMMVN